MSGQFAFQMEQSLLEIAFHPRITKSRYFERWRALSIEEGSLIRSLYCTCGVSESWDRKLCTKYCLFWYIVVLFDIPSEMSWHCLKVCRSHNHNTCTVRDICSGASNCTKPHISVDIYDITIHWRCVWCFLPCCRLELPSSYILFSIEDTPAFFDGVKHIRALREVACTCTCTSLSSFMCCCWKFDHFPSRLTLLIGR